MLRIKLHIILTATYNINLYNSIYIQYTLNVGNASFVYSDSIKTRIITELLSGHQILFYKKICAS